MRAKPKRIEAQEQESLVEWFRLQYPQHLLFAIPNGLVRNVYQAACSKRGGLVAGIPDLMLAVPNKTYHGLFVEMKRGAYLGVSPGKPTIEQLDIIRHLNSCGYSAIIAYGFWDAKKQIEAYLNDV